ncbi:hypothetical protein SDC9_138107 [bioreactor metagenome]|uniref:Uncharacterized protein n=1 Tax=bioreactor metagenome TaxID=1076179 RepID=A0A645DR79_9ZZZZ
MRAGDHKHGGHALDHFYIEPNPNRPSDGSDHSGAQSDVKQPPGSSVSQQLCAALRHLSLLHQTHDTGKSSLIACGGHPYTQAAIPID